MRRLFTRYEVVSAQITKVPVMGKRISGSVPSGVAGTTTRSTSPGSSTVLVPAMKVAESAAAAKRLVAKQQEQKRAQDGIRSTGIVLLEEYSWIGNQLDQLIDELRKKLEQSLK